MNTLKDLLSELRSGEGVRGAAVVTLDGLLAAGDLDDRLDAAAVAGLASYLHSTTARSLRENGLGDHQAIVVHANHGKAICVRLDDSMLVVLCDQFADLPTTRAAANRAATRLRAIAQIR
ncbi:MAG: roadblock/LC7 domain-containing protein [Planctomycetes bacterium]|nr:roadblock/LC7 domain-containing protein [Planctomycetota bacterium]